MPRSDRFVATVLFTDIVGSTELASKLGDRGWRRVLKAHHDLIRQELKRYGGREVDTAGDGFFASFSVPADAARCALAISNRMWDLGIGVRAGIHTGEVQIVDGKVAGIAAHIGARVASGAGSGEVLTTGTVRDIVTGSELRFDGRGSRELKGVPGEWSIFGVDDGSVGKRGPLPDLDPSLIPPDQEPSGRGRSRLLVVGVVGAAVAIAGTVLVLALLPSKKEATRPKATPQVQQVTSGLARLDPATGKVVKRVEFQLGNRYYHVTAAQDADGFIETVDGNTGVIYKVNPTSDTVVNQESVPLATLFNSVVFADGKLWVATGPSPISGPDRAPTRVLWIDPHDLKELHLLAELPGKNANGLAFGEGALWLSLEEGQVVRVDPGTGKTTTIDLEGHNASAIAAGEGSVWLVDVLAGVLLRIDPTTLQISTPIPLSSQPSLVTVADGSIWVSELGHAGKGLIERFPPDLASNSTTYEVGTEPRDVQVAAGAAWVSNRRQGTVSRVDLESGTVTTITLGGLPDGIVATDTAIWVTLARPA